jgi:hypothetical protein
VTDHNGYPVAGLAVTYAEEAELGHAAVAAVRRTAREIGARLSGG